MIKILFIGDIAGKLGRKTVAKLLPKIKKEHKPDLIIANAENAAHGKGVTKNILDELMDLGIDYFTNGDHAFSARKQLDDIYNGSYPIIRPANFPPETPGVGHTVIDLKGYKIGLVNLIGRVFMKMYYDCPFRAIDNILANFAKQNLSAIILDVHAETTAEKVTLGHYVDGRVSAILGTHTHVMTADAKITAQDTAYITDVGMTGFSEGSIGLAKEGIIKTFLTQIKYPHVLPEKGSTQLNAVVLTINPKNGQAKSIKPIIKFTKIN